LLLTSGPTLDIANPFLFSFFIDFLVPFDSPNFLTILVSVDLSGGLGPVILSLRNIGTLPQGGLDVVQLLKVPFLGAVASVSDLLCHQPYLFSTL
jgi:hypothetical protein